jgi:hypothetical protein
VRPAAAACKASTVSAAPPSQEWNPKQAQEIIHMMNEI